MGGETTASAVPVAAGRDGVRLRAVAPVAAGTVVLAFCRGVEVGRLAIVQALAAGREFVVPIARLPWVEFPATLRFALDAAGPDLGPGWELANEAAAASLVGAGDLALMDVRMAAGVLRGLARNRVNAAVRPVLYARLNGVAARGVAVGAAVPLAEGGASWPFALALEPGDLGEEGLAVTLFGAADAVPIARVAWARDEAGAPAAALEARVDALERAAVAMEARLLEALTRRLALHGERIDAFIEAAAALLLDRVAGDPPAALRALVGDIPAEVPAVTSVLERVTDVPLGSGYLALGWHALEMGEDGVPFRWMAAGALVVNPEAHRAVTAVTLAVRHLYAAEAPMLAAGFDAAPAVVDVAAGAADWVVRLTPVGGAVACRTVRLNALASGVPAAGGTSDDGRRLSLGVAGVAFEYAA